MNSILTLEGTARYLGVSKTYVYNLTRLRKIRHFKPLAGKIFFLRSDIDQWLESGVIEVVKN